MGRISRRARSRRIDNDVQRGFDFGRISAESMGNETGGLPHQAGGDAQSALESAARHLRGSPRPARTTPARDREILGGRQTRDLLAWADENRCLIEPSSYLDSIEDAGQEHRVWLNKARQRYFKATFPNRCGFSVMVLQAGEPELVASTPLEYLERLLLHNQIFGDQIQLEGVATESERLVILTSQPNITGTEASREEILEFMQRLWFARLDGLSLGNPGSLAFYRDLDELAIFDAHPGNFVKDTNGAILPIDLIMVRADPDLQNAVQRFLQTD
jgi:hypothetical protein